DVHFEWRKTGDEMWNETPEQTMNSTGGFNHELTDLEPENEYEFRCVSNHSQPGSILTFTTESEVEEKEEGIPGFTSLLLLVASIIAVAIYQKKSNKQ
ncbi:MAG: fibronectin type III domain-containing protein, partial [Candidatus Natronoplasma sp.]